MDNTQEQILNAPTFSPPPTVVPAELTFDQAIKELIAGKRITRKSWSSIDEYGILADGWLTIHTKGKFHQWLVNDGDLLAVDWIAL